MGNEFGHPEWIDFPREGNGWSHKYARRQWNLVDNKNLCYHYLGDFDSAMIHTLREMKNIQDTPVIEVWHNDSDQVLAYRRKNNIFVFNFNPTRSFTDYGFLVSSFNSTAIAILLFLQSFLESAKVVKKHGKVPMISQKYY